MEVTLREGALGQYDVEVDGELVASRSSNLLLRLVGGGWPDERDVIEAVRARLAR